MKYDFQSRISVVRFSVNFIRFDFIGLLFFLASYCVSWFFDYIIFLHALLWFHHWLWNVNIILIVRSSINIFNGNEWNRDGITTRDKKNTPIISINAQTFSHSHFIEIFLSIMWRHGFQCSALSWILIDPCEMGKYFTRINTKLRA